MKDSIARSFTDCGLTPELALESSNSNSYTIMGSLVAGLFSRPKFRVFDLLTANKMEVELKIDPIFGDTLLRGSDFEEDNLDIGDIDDIDEEDDELDEDDHEEDFDEEQNSEEEFSGRFVDVDSDLDDEDTK